VGAAKEAHATNRGNNKWYARFLIFAIALPSTSPSRFEAERFSKAHLWG